jgi:hypothetical protein
MLAALIAFRADIAEIQAAIAMRLRRSSGRLQYRFFRILAHVALNLPTMC